jgi:hypothetical protein
MTGYDLIVKPARGDEQRRLQTACARLQRRGLELNWVPATGHYLVGVVVGEIGIPIAEPKSLQDVLCLCGWLDGLEGKARIAAARAAAQEAEGLQ